MSNSPFLQQAILDSLEDFLIQKEATILNKDPDALHRLRVSGLKIRIRLWSCKLLFPMREYNKIKKEIHNVCKSLNPARDLDTQIYLLLKLKAEKRVIKYLKDQRIKLQPQIVKDLARIDRLKLRERIEKCLNNSKALLDNQTLLEISKGKLHKKLKKLLSYAHGVNYPTKLNRLHSLRMAAKHLRYTLELFQPVYAKGLSSFISNARWIQRTLGDMRNYLILSRCRALNNPQLKNRLISLTNKSYRRFAEIWKNQSIWRDLNTLINAEKTF